MRNRFLFLLGLIAFVALLLLGCTMSLGQSASTTPTPTKTQRPLFTATSTPTAQPLPTDTSLPSDTPVPSDTPAPTDTLAPPADTPVPADSPVATETMAPTDPPVLPTDTQVAPTDTPVPPTNSPQPMPTNTPAPPTSTPKPQVDFRVTEQRLMAKSANEAQLHSIWIRVTDAGGNALDGVAVWDPKHPDQEAVSGSKPDLYSAEYQLWDYGAYQLEVKGARSAQTKVLSTEVHLIPKEDLVAAGYCSDITSCNPDELVQHYSWFVTFQRTW